MGLHPLLDLALAPDVRRSASFREIAARLSGEELGAGYRAGLAHAPDRGATGRRYFTAYNRRLAAERHPDRDAEHLSLALADWGSRDEQGLTLPDAGGRVRFLQAQVSIRSAAEDPARGEQDPNRGLGRIDLLGAAPEGRLVVASVHYIAPSATRGGTGDTPLRSLLEGLAHTAVAQARRDALAQEIVEAGGPALGDAPPLLLLIGSPRYWEISRRREAQKGAAWIREMERLAGEVEVATGVGVHFLACQTSGDPGWIYAEGGPRFETAPRLVRAWEYGAGRVRPKARPRAKPAAPADLPVEADPTRPIRAYAASEVYRAGDRIDHPTLGLGVVQGSAGQGKVNVLFGERKSVLVHERPLA